MTRYLLQLPQSPWSERARWALDHHGVSYRAVEYLPFVYAPIVRLASGEPARQVTVPMLFDDGRVLRDSIEIGRHAESLGGGAKLFTDEGAVLHYCELSDRFLQAARIRALHRLALDDEALRESLPPLMARAPSAFVPVARTVTRMMLGKYDTTSRPPAETEATLATVLADLDETLGSADYLAGGAFSFADIAVASALGFVRPHPRAPLGQRERLVYTEPKLEALFPRLLAWRDRIVERHR